MTSIKTMTPILPIGGYSLTMPLQAAVTFHTDFDEANIGDITGLNIDMPALAAGQGNDGSGTVVLNATNETLDITSMDANMWGSRDGAPIAWVLAPLVAVGVTWYAQT